MSDDLQIPIVTAGPGSRAPMSTFYHPRASGRRASRGVSSQGVMVAGGVAGAVLLAAVGGWALLHRGPVVVPVIEADSRPLRVKPDNPGGMQFADGDDTPGGPQSMAPAAEAPAPQALRAQMQLPAAPAPAAAAPPAVAALPGAVASASPLPDTTKADTTRPDTTKPAARVGQPAAQPGTPARPVASPAASPAAGATMVQVAALESEAAAQGEWQRLAKKMPDLLGDRRPVLQKAERDGKAIWRVRLAGFGDMADATAFCTKLRARGGSCAIATF